MVALDRAVETFRHPLRREPNVARRWRAEGVWSTGSTVVSSRSPTPTALDSDGRMVLGIGAALLLQGHHLTGQLWMTAVEATWEGDRRLAYVERVTASIHSLDGK